MAEKKTHKSGADGGTIIQLNLVGAIVFSIALVAASALVTYGLIKSHSQNSKTLSPSGPANLDDLDIEEKNPPPCGQLVTRDIELEQPEEYVAYETVTNRVEKWTFEKMSAEQVRSAMQSAGVAANEIQRATMVAENENVVVTPDDELVLSLNPQNRAKLYNLLAKFDSNEFMRFPFVFKTNTFNGRFDDGKLNPEISALLKKLIYRRGETDCFSDLAMVLRRISDDAERLRFVKALSRQSAVLV